MVQSHRASYSILVVYEDRDFLEAVAFVLENQLETRVVTCSSLDDALRMQSTRHFDAVVMSANFNGKSGSLEWADIAAQFQVPTVICGEFREEFKSLPKHIALVDVSELVSAIAGSGRRSMSIRPTIGG